MRILYDHQMFSIQQYGGITRYFCELLKNFPSEHQFTLSLIFSDNHYLKENEAIFKTLDILPNNKFRGKHFIKKNLYNINQYYSKYYISKSKFDLFHPTFYNDYFICALKKPYIITVHDLIAFKYNDSFDKSNNIKSQMVNVIKNANRIISVSENTKKDLIEILNVNPNTIDVIYHGYNEINPCKKIEGLGKYILFVGERDSYKNFTTFAEAISNLFIREKDLKLVCVGAPFTTDEIKLLIKLKIANKALAMYVDNSRLNYLYSNALLFVYPSLYEGFGIPILEAFVNKCPVCLSNTSCFPEIAGDAGIYFNPLSQDSILDSMEKILYNSDLAEVLIKAGQNRLKLFSWSKTIQDTFNSYKRTI